MSAIDFSGGNTNTPEGDDKASEGGNVNQPGSEADQGFIEYNGRRLTQEEVLKKLEHADTHIETLVAEREADRQRLTSLEDAVSKSTKVEDVLKALQGDTGKPADESTLAPSDNGADLNALLDQKLAERDAQRAEEANWQGVTGTLSKAFGSKTNEKVAEIAAEHDMSLEEAQSFAKKRPKAFLKLFGNLDSGTTTPSTPSYRNPAARHDDTHNAPSGYMEAKTTKDQVSIYKQKLAKFGL